MGQRAPLALQERRTRFLKGDTDGVFPTPDHLCADVQPQMRHLDFKMRRHPKRIIDINPGSGLAHVAHDARRDPRQHGKTEVSTHESAAARGLAAFSGHGTQSGLFDPPMVKEF